MNCREYFFRLLSRKEYSVYELRKKGENKGYEPDEINETLTFLQQENYQSDLRLVEDMISAAQGKYGKPMIKRKCLAKGITSDLFEQGWSKFGEDFNNDELAELKKKAMRKYKLDNFDNLDQKTKAKLFNFLQYRGFKPFEILEQWQRET